MKLVVLALVVTTLVFVFVLGGISFTDDLYECYERASSQIKSDRIAASSQYWGEQTICQVGKEVYDEYNYCMDRKLGFWQFARPWFEVVVTTIEPVANQVVEEFKQHNDRCYKYTDLVLPLNYDIIGGE